MRIFCLLLLLIPMVLFGQNEIVYYNGVIFTGNSQQPYADAVAIKGEKIVAVGNYSDVVATVSLKSTGVNLNGACLIPGLVDSHIHALSGGISLTRANVFDNFLSPAQLLEKVREIISNKTMLMDGMVVIYGLSIATWADLDVLDKTFNTTEFSNQAIWLRGSDYHTAWANKAMLKKAGVDQAFIKSLDKFQRKFFGFNASLEPNGFSADSGLAKFNELIPEGKVDYHLAALKAMQYCTSNGITAWLDPSAASTSDSITPELDAYRWLDSTHQLIGHVAATIVADADGNALEQIDMVKRLKEKYNPSVSILGFKVFADGVVEYPTQTAAMSRPYINNPSTSGVLMFTPARFASFATQADKNGLLVHVHAIGDLAVTETLNGFESVRKTNGNSGIPHTITHLQFVLPSDFPRFKKLNVLASMQLLWAYGDVTTIDIIEPYVQASIYKYQYPVRSMMHEGATICGASDWPVSSANPFEAMATAETRKGLKGVLDSTQCMPRISMLYAYTINAAKALRMEDRIGSIEPGKYADFVLVDRDVMTISSEALRNSRVLWTMFKGKIVYSLGQ